MIWLIAIIIAYSLLAVVSLIDRYLLVGRPNPEVYSFYVGMLSGLLAVLIPFLDFFVPNLVLLGLAFLAGALTIAALFALYTGLQEFEASRIVTASGGLTPLFSFLLVWVFPGGEKVLSLSIVMSFLLLTAGSVVVTWRKKALFKGSLKISAVAAFLFALAFFLSKQVYQSLPFLNGLVLIRIGSFLAALLFLGSEKTRKEIFKKHQAFDKKTGSLFLFNQGLGFTAIVAQNLAIALAGVSLLPVIHALQGLEYGFLFLLALVFSSRFPRLLKEEPTPRVVAKKVGGIVLISIGLAILAL